MSTLLEEPGGKLRLTWTALFGRDRELFTTTVSAVPSLSMRGQYHLELTDVGESERPSSTQQFGTFVPSAAVARKLSELFSRMAELWPVNPPATGEQVRLGWRHIVVLDESQSAGQASWLVVDTVPGDVVARFYIDRNDDARDKAWAEAARRNGG